MEQDGRKKYTGKYRVVEASLELSICGGGGVRKEDIETRGEKGARKNS